MGVINISGISDSRVAPICGSIIKEQTGPTLIVAPTFLGAKRLASDISFFVSKKVYLVPSDEEGFKSYEAKNRDTLFGFLDALRALATREDCVLVAPVSMAIKKLAPKAAFLSRSQELQVGSDVKPLTLAKDLIAMGYERVPLVYNKGQFSLRGDIMDIFTPYSENPVRMELFDTEVDRLRSFDPISQRSIEKVDSLSLYPACLIVQEPEVLERGRRYIEKVYKNLPQRREELLESLETGSNSQQLETYMDYFYEEATNLLGYLDPQDVVIVDDPNRVYELVEERYKALKADFDVLVERGLLTKKDMGLFPGKKEVLDIYKRDKVYLCTPFSRAVKGIDAYEDIRSIESRQTLSYNGKMDILEKDLRRFLMKGYDTTLVCSTPERFDNLQDFLSRCGLEGRIHIKQGALTAGMEFPEKRVVYITDGDIFGVVRKNQRRRRTKDKNRRPIASFSDIATGDFVVHETQGIGRFAGLEQLTVRGEKKDYLKIQYAGNDVLYVPTDQMDLIQKYIGGDAESTKVSKLNGKDWRKTKAKAKASIAKMAKELLEISAQREKDRGYAFGPDTVWQREFEDSFPYQETDDQLRCVEEIKKDMESERPMDRLLCGDVGYGKTEVAARAMFKCAAEGKQVCVLVPTTILASQHYYTLKERFEKFPFTVDMISRFRSEKEQQQTLRRLAAGNVDVIIGTHRLLSEDVQFKNLGLLVIDEEQRFGVQHKERIKKLKNNVDVLTLSATPIPRTLHMSLLGIRDMSLIEEPPEERYPVQTYVMEEDDFVIKEAIQREIQRGGQVYVIHNRVQSIYRLADRIDALVPNLRIGVGHGQMNEMALEDVMMEFMDGELDVLVATTIVESGIDIPNVNTIIVVDADKFGLSQLYQLRGRVGRSNRLAYAYLLHEKNQELSDIAQRRLKAIKAFTEFGAGFKISMRDLEIRGAGNILGSEQSGHMVNVGYELYCKLVNDAVKALKGEVVPSTREDTSVEINVSAYIPNTYIVDEVTKLTMYKKIAAIDTKEDVADIREELMDRFGDIPKVTENLMRISYCRALGEALDLRKISVSKGRLILSYDAHAGISPLVLYLTKGQDVLTEVIEILEIMKQKTEKEG